ncbi:MAG: hypothetical protein PWQ37_940 [Candidatus Petromonas sp.]|jgi:sulfur carrier protein ThiS|nr:hypothetical protein [Candidatus Petromonas sp.]
MSDHYINYNMELETDGNARLMDIIKSVGKDEELIITMEGNDAEKSKHILKILENNGFEVLPKGGHEDNQYHLVARKRMH